MPATGPLKESSPHIKAPWLRYGFYGRIGGFSGGAYASLNPSFGVGDDPDHVAQNRARILQDFSSSEDRGEDWGEDRLFLARQVHGSTVHVCWAGDQPPVDACDGLITATEKLAVGVVTADCAPVLIVSREPRIVGVVHAGWRGVVAGVLESAVAGMETCGGQNLVAVIGPTIGPDSYEIGKDFHQTLLDHDSHSADFFHTPAHKTELRMHFDLPGYAAMRLRKAGVNAQWIGLDTVARADAWHSRRFNLAKGQTTFGSNLLLAAIVSGKKME